LKWPLTTITPETLLLREGHIAQVILDALERVDGENPAHHRRLLKTIIEWDAREVKGVDALWWKIDIEKLDIPETTQIRRFIATARLPGNAIAAFQRYSQTEDGKAETELNDKALEDYIAYYLAAAFARKDPLPYLAALGGKEKPNQHPHSDFLGLLKEMKITLSVTKEQYAVIKDAWKDAPRALEHVRVKEDAPK
jgi:hypothetical protein